MPTKLGSTRNNSARYICDISKVQPGDVLLSRIPMDLDNESTWDSHLIRSLTRSSFSYAALCVADGLFIEAVGTGVARLPLWNAGIRDIRNVRVLRPSKDYRWAAIRAAACGLSYLERGFYQQGAPRPKCTAFQDVRRAAASSSDIVVNAYLGAGLELKSSATDKVSDSVFAGDLVNSAFFEDITHHVLQPLSVPTRAVFNLDDDTLRQRIHHWEVETQLKVLCKYEVRRILELKSEKPSSLAELETLIATNQWRSLDSALHHSLRWYRYDKLYRVKQNQLLDDISVWAPDSNLSSLGDDHELLSRSGEREIFNLIQMEANYCRKQRDRYKDLIAMYKCSSFYYMHDLFSDQEAKLGRIVDSFKDEKESSLLMENFMADYVYKNKKYEERLTHKKYYEIN